ncbi:hypothetical protein SCLCIDRAFT_1223819 [Scleroderma citrinum Foug A]|uniref:Uncharacterized protein n=1 Tax=Scleroderma citrinum Foug A TaxID=1036808 RepID=A0A0C3D7L9_9AGAM|nr:hypothetical protein SCLCIDRAFT_1223819 [Scleroderma citrinum Foug A]
MEVCAYPGDIALLSTSATCSQPISHSFVSILHLFQLEFRHLDALKCAVQIGSLDERRSILFSSTVV